MELKFHPKIKDDLKKMFSNNPIYLIPRLLEDIPREIKFAFQRMLRGYDNSFMWGMDRYLEQYFIPAIEIFCKDKLKEETDEKRTEIYSTMLKLIDDWKKQDNGIDDQFEIENTSSKMWSHFGNNIGYFWD